MKILVVGGAGYLGGAVTDLLMDSGHEVCVYDILLYEEMYRKNVPFVYGDIRDREKLQPQLDWADQVIWLAALVGDPACALNEDLTREINVGSIGYLREHYKGRIIFMSTCSVYGASDGLLDEKSPLNPLSLYARTKLQAEEILQPADALIFRLGTLYGISDRFARIRFDLVVNTLVMRAVVHGKISVFGGTQYRPLLHVRDAADGIVRCLGQKKGGIYNLHSENVTIIEIAERLHGYFPDLKIDKADTMFQDNRNYRVTSDKAHNDLNLVPRLTVDDGIREIKATLTDGRIRDSFTSRFSNYLFLKPLLNGYQSPLGKSVKFNI